MAYRVKYVPTADEVRKLNSLRTQAEYAFKASAKAWSNHDFDNAVELYNQGNSAISKMNAFFGKLCKWRNDGVETTGYAK